MVSNSNKDGASSFQKHYDLFEDVESGSLDALRKSIYSISNCISSSNEEDILYFSGQKKDKKEIVIDKCGSLKPCIHGSDAHTEEKLFTPDDQKYCWIKADTTFEGLKQIIYEPEPGERVKISTIEPDQKDGYKIISKIRFTNTKDFPEHILFNKNLCSIIGSRSSGKSALLAYLAHAVDKETTEYLIDGPGNGEEFHWENIKIGHSIEWGNGQTNDESREKIFYIPQNHLFNESNNSNKIKEKIQPVLFKVLPDFKIKYEQTMKNISIYNQTISSQVDDLFDLYDVITLLKEQLKTLGDKKSVENEKNETEGKIKILKEKYQLSDEDLDHYQKLSSFLNEYENKKNDLDTKLSQISDVSDKNEYFIELKITLSPALANLPKELQDKIRIYLDEDENRILKAINNMVLDYKNSIAKIITDMLAAVSKAKEENGTLIEKYKKNVELEDLIKKLSEHDRTIQKINETESILSNSVSKLKEYEEIIKNIITKRTSLIEEIARDIDDADQSTIDGIKFGLEYDYKENIMKLMPKINVRDSSEFIDDKGLLKISKIRNNPEVFLCAIYSGIQKINKGYDGKQVAKDSLTLTEKILFSAKMEGDKIGGFSEPTMTAGKRALFLLRLILEESQDTWPLLIDQPEDDLDSNYLSRYCSIFKEKEKRTTDYHGKP